MRAANNFALVTDPGTRARDPSPTFRTGEWTSRSECGADAVAAGWTWRWSSCASTSERSAHRARPRGTPRGLDVGAIDRKKPSLPARAADLCETALVVACLGAADPHGAARASRSRSPRAAPRAPRPSPSPRVDEPRPPTASTRGSLRRENETADGKIEAVSARWLVGARHRPRGAGGASVRRRVFAARLRRRTGAVAPESHHAVKSAAALAARVAFSQPTKKRRGKARRVRPRRRPTTGRGPPASRDAFAATRAASFEDDAGGVDVKAWHARYRWAALRLAPFGRRARARPDWKRARRDGWPRRRAAPSARTTRASCAASRRLA